MERFLTRWERVQKMFKTRGALVNHLKKDHPELTVADAAATGNPSMVKINAARGKLMSICSQPVPDFIV